MVGGYRKSWQDEKKKGETLAKNVKLDLDRFLPKQDLGPKLDKFEKALKDMLKTQDQQKRKAMAKATFSAYNDVIAATKSYETHFTTAGKSQAKDQSTAGKLSVRILRDLETAVVNIRGTVETDVDELR